MHIAKFLQSEASKPIQQLSYNFANLKTLVRSRDKFIRKRSDEIVIITNSLDKIFPEFKGFFNNRLGETCLCILEKFNSRDKIAKLTVNQIQKIHNISRKISVNKLTQLKDLAKNSIGFASLADELIIKNSIKVIRVINESIENIEKEIIKIMKEIKSPICSIPGIGIMSAASICAEYGDFKNFSSPNKLLAYAGLECSKNQSGTTEFKGRMVKHGSQHLRYVLMNVAVSVKNHCPTFASYFKKNMLTNIRTIELL